MAIEKKMSVFLFVIKFLLIVVYLSIHANGICLGSTSQPCCADYIWIEEEGKCVRCTAGFYGVNCTKTCRYPSFGSDCQQRCYCPEHYCHVTIGCVYIGRDKRNMGFPTSDFLLGCIICLLIVLVVFKVLKLIPFYRRYIEVRTNVTRHSTQRKYDSLKFDARSPTHSVLQNSLDEEGTNIETD